MLNGIDPIIIFQFKIKSPEVSEAIAKIPLVSQFPSLIDLPPIPLYLSENITGIFIDAESKSLDASTQMETKTDGSDLAVNQKGIASVVSIDMVANKNSLGVSLFTAMADLIFEKMTSKEYFISYLHGPVTIFQGLLHSFSVNQVADDDLLRIKVELSRGNAKNLPSVTNPRLPSVTKVTGGIPS